MVLTPIDLLNGSDFADKLKELSIGIRTEKVELVHIEESMVRHRVIGVKV